MGHARLGWLCLALVGAAVAAGVTLAPGLGVALGSSAQGQLAALAVGVSVALLGGIPLYASLRRRLARLTRAARAMAGGDFDAPLPPPGDDEIGQLVRAWRRMRVAMEEQVLELRGEADRRHAILDGMHEGVALLGQGEIVAANAAFARLIGAAGPLEGKTILEAARLPDLAEAVEEARRSGAQVVRELSVDERTLRVAARPLPGKEGRAVVVLLDMTEARRLERLRRDFVANASHELRTPVAAILGAAETLAAGAGDDAAARASFLDILSRHAHRLTQLTADLLDLARLEAGYRPRREEVPVAEVIAEVISSLAPRAAARGLDLRSEADEREGSLVVVAERAAVGQILTNLVDNAIKYTREGGRVRVGARRTADGVELSVADNGQGIPPQHLPRLFERFYRVDQARSRELGGTGLGLAIVRHLAAAHGGEARVESVLGHGATFYVRLPGPGAEAKSSQESHEAAAAGR